MWRIGTKRPCHFIHQDASSGHSNDNWYSEFMNDDERRLLLLKDAMMSGLDLVVSFLDKHSRWKNLRLVYRRSIILRWYYWFIQLSISSSTIILTAIRRPMSDFFEMLGLVYMTPFLFSHLTSPWLQLLLGLDAPHPLSLLTQSVRHRFSEFEVVRLVWSSKESQGSNSVNAKVQNCLDNFFRRSPWTHKYGGTRWINFE
jgi:hypothetical protein